MIKQNPNPPKVTFRMIRGRIIPIVNGKQPRGATKVLREEVNSMIGEVKHAEKGVRGVGYNEQGEAVKNYGTKSTFPKFFGELHFNSRKQFLDIVEKKKGARYEAFVDKSIDGLLHGRESSFGRIPPNEKFRQATKQEFNNKGVIFRKIEGKVIPLRPRYPRDEEVPF